VDQRYSTLTDMWQTTAEPLPAALSFGNEATATSVSRWLMDLPANPSAAMHRLTSLEMEHQTIEEGLVSLPDRLERLSNQVNGDVSFAVVPDGPEKELLQAMAEIRGEVSFAPGQPSTLQSVGEQFHAAMQHLFRLLTHLAWIETRSEGVLLGQTIIGWGGDTQTLWNRNSRTEDRALHQRNLRLALATRLTQLRLLIIATQAAAKISLLLGSSGGVGAVLVLPVAWNYVNQILRELERNKTLTSSI